METIASAAATREPARGEAVARAVVQASLVAAVIAGSWLLSLTQPRLAAAAIATFLAAALLARWRFDLANLVVLFFAYTSTGLLLLVTSSNASAPLWLALLAGLVAGGCSWTQWTAPVAWRWPLMAWLLGIALSWPIVAGREADFGTVTAGDAVALVVVNAAIALAVGLWLDAALGWDLKRIERRAALPLLASVVVAAAAVFYQGLVDITWLSSQIWIQLRRAPGLMGDANPMAIAAAMWAPLAPFVLTGRVWRIAGLALVPFLWYAAWLTGARSVILLVAAGALGLLIGSMAGRVSKRRALVALGAAAAVAAAAFLLASRQPGSSPLGRLTATLPLDRPLDLAYEVFWRRDGYGLAAVRAIQEHPWSGVGHGVFNHLSSYYYRLEEGPPVPPDNAQNLWRHALAERGLLGFVAVLALTIATMRLLVRDAPRIAPAYAWTLKAVVCGLGLVLLFGVPVQNPAIALTAALCLAWLHAAVKPGFETARPLSTVLLGVVWALAIAGAVADAWNARGDLRPPARAARVGVLYTNGIGQVESGPRGVSGRVVVDEAVAVLPVRGPQYRFHCWVRGTEARHVRVWQDGRLVVDELLPAGVLIERTLDAPATPGMMLEISTEEPGIVIGGEFVS